ncbi:MAG: hypothetical protein ABSG25_12180 [Bryobacteraceae bacterium]
MQLALAGDAASSDRQSNLERVVIFAIQQESKTTDFKSAKHLCIGFGHGLSLHERAIISALRRSGMKANSTGRCGQGPHDLLIDVNAPINEPSPGTFEVTIDVGNPWIEPGTCFAILLRRGTYTVRAETGSEPKLVSYRQTCCDKSN